MIDRQSPRGLWTAFFGLLLVPLLIAFPYVRALNNPNEVVRVYTVIALVENGTYAIDEQVEAFGWTNDMARIRRGDAERYYMVKAPGIVHAGIPGYALFSKVIAPLLGKRYPSPQASEEDRRWWLEGSTWALRLTTSQLPCLLFLVWLERYLRSFSRDGVLRASAVVAAGLGTNYLAYAHMFASHSQYAIVGFLAFATIERELRRSCGDASQTRPQAAALAGFLTSACVTLEYQALFMTLVMSLFALHVFGRPLRTIGALLRGDQGQRPTLTRVVAFLLGGALNVPLVMWFQHCAYGNAFTPGHKQLETARFAAEHRTGLWGILWPAWDHIVTLAIDPGFGFFGLSPFMWLGLASVPYLLLTRTPQSGQPRHLRTITLAWFASMAAVLLVNAGFIEWRAGWTIGPRYLVVCAPFFAFGGLLALERFAERSGLRRAIARGVGAGLCLAGVATIGTVGLLVDTLPDTIRRPFAQFFVPMVRVGLVPHHLGEWIGWTSGALWYAALAVLLLLPLFVGVWTDRSETRMLWLVRVGSLLLAAFAGMVPALTPPADGSALFVLHPSTVWFATSWEPARAAGAIELRDESTRWYAQHAQP